MANGSRTFRHLGRARVPHIALCLSALAICQPAQAADGKCDFFDGKTVELVVPFSAGGGFDVYGRMVAKFMGAELGAANMIVRNQPGAGGLLATNQTWNAKADGLRIQMISVSGAIAAELGGADGVGFKINEFGWIGRISGEPDVVATPPDSTLDSLAAIKKVGAERPLRIGSTGVGSPQYISATLLAQVLETKSEVITGFSGAPEVYASLGRGELDLFSSSLSSAISAEKAQTGKVVWLLGTAAIPARPDVKPISDIIDAKFLPLLKVHEDSVAAGRALAGPPGVPADRLQCLRDAFDRTMASPALIEETRQLNRPVEPLGGEQVAELVKNATEGAPPEYLELLRKSFAQ